MKQGIDWPAIEQDYLTGSTGSLRALADKHGVSTRQIFRKASAGGWARRRAVLKTKGELAAMAVVEDRGREIGVSLADAVEPFRLRMVTSLAKLANRLDALAEGEIGSGELRTLSQSLRDVWGVGSEVHGLAGTNPSVAVRVELMTAISEPEIGIAVETG